MKLPEVVITERDAQMWEMRRNGANPRQIGKALGISESTVYKGLKRIESKVIKELAVGYQQEWLLDLQRMDSMILSFLPSTKPTKMQTPDGEEITIPPSVDSANIVLKTIAQRFKHLGFDQNSNMDMAGPGGATNVPAIGPAEVDEKEKTPETEARELLKVLVEAGVLNANDSVFSMIKEAANPDEIVDAEVVDDDDVAVQEPEIEPVFVEPPAFVDSYDEESPEDDWTQEL